MFLVILVLLVLRERRVQQALKAMPVPKALRGLKVPKVLKALLDLKVIQGLPERPVHRVLPDLPGPQAEQVRLALKGLQDQLVLLGRQARSAQEATQGLLEILVPKEK